MIVKYDLQYDQPHLDHILDITQNQLPLDDWKSPQDRQNRRVLALSGYIDPGNINDYISSGGYSGLAKALELQPEEIIRDIMEAGLRGRGGAGFSTGLKWTFARKIS